MIRVLPLEQAKDALLPEVAHSAGGDDPLSWAPVRQFTPSGRAALTEILGRLELAADDEVYITNTSHQTYVSSCVTCTVFNHCQPSRVLTDRTRAMLVIHEYGYPHPETYALREEADRRGIPLIEDCAHSLDSHLDGVPLGSIGDFAIFSLPKVMPVAAGGILVARGAAAGAADADEMIASLYARHAGAAPEYARRRRRNYQAVREHLPSLPVSMEPGPGVDPFYVPLVTPHATEIRRRSKTVEWGSTLRDDLLLVTTNPFVTPEELVAALEAAFASLSD